MSEWNYTKCSKPFGSQQEAKEFMIERNFAGQILLRDNGGYTAVCPTYPEGYYPDAIPVETIDESMLGAPARSDHLVGTLTESVQSDDELCCDTRQEVSITSPPR
ncbi:hypothetical protein [Pontimonas sp.]|jgi:hypothetical protein|uniref:hypothetical protein n=1 Tax=Pontimonas sp. TaxID=2304492 RepID=UPI0028709686|nr:hypothetical protein [Pontimonas sp.]MDR9396552.1 hypothetical protein [Pontimonas sp.]MDR9434145.1 hypothetical protein [Pontimonas sp.]